MKKHFLIYGLVGLLLISFSLNAFADDEPGNSSTSDEEDTFEIIQEGVKEAVEDVRDNPYQIMDDEIQEEFVEPLEESDDEGSEE